MTPIIKEVMKMRELPSKVMDVEEVAEILHVHRTQVYKLVRENRLPGAFRLGKRILISRAVFDDWLRNPNSV